MSDLNNQINDNESEITDSQGVDLENYKGIFYQDEDEQKEEDGQEEEFFECGAHFSYPEIIKKLEKLQEELKLIQEEEKQIQKENSKFIFI